MKNKKFANIITIAGACALVIFSVFVFPFIIAASPDNQGIETIETEAAYPPDETEQPGEDGQPGEGGQPGEDGDGQQPGGENQPDNGGVTIDINAISKETAIALALDATPHEGVDYVDPTGDTRSFSIELRGARYVESADPLDAPIWQVLFYVRDSGKMFHEIHENFTPDEYLHYLYGDMIHDCCFVASVGSFDNGTPAIVYTHNQESLFVIEVNALTGDLVGQGIVYLCDHISRFDTFSYDDITDWSMANDFSFYWVLVREDGKIPMPESRPIPAPQPIPEPGTTPLPTPQPSPQPQQWESESASSP